MLRILGFSVLCVFVVAAAQAAEPARWRVPEGFEATLFADDALATDITAMTIDPQGRVCVSGPGYIKILHDDDRDGRADRATLFSDTLGPGAEGMVFLQSNLGALYLACVRDGKLSLLSDSDRDDRADGNATELLKFRTGGLGARGLCQGPDGALYVACGSETELDPTNVDTLTSPLKTIKGGALLRVKWQTGNRLAYTAIDYLADGFSNPTDVDFLPAGNVLTIEGDNEPALGLPWYAPMRLFDVALGRNHGWLRAGNRGGWNRPSYFPDAVEPAATMGTGVSSGLTVYRHRQFPAHYRGGVFTGCWDRGRVDFLSVTPEGSTVRAKQEPFFETLGEVGLAPSDIAVGPEGDLFVSCGGHGTRGAVIRIRHTAGRAAMPQPLKYLLSVQDVLHADQPQSAWSRDEWVAAATKLGSGTFLKVIVDPAFDVADQVRAVEILAELFGEIPEQEIPAALALKRPELSARLAWAIDRWIPGSAGKTTLAELTFDPDPRVLLAAWDYLRVQSATPMIYHPTRPPNWQLTYYPKLDPRVRTSMELAVAPAPLNIYSGMRKADAVQYEELKKLKELRTPINMLDSFAAAADKDGKLRALRALQIHYDDFKLDGTFADVLAGYWLSWPSKVPDSLKTDAVVQVEKELSATFPTGDADVDRELARTLVSFNKPDGFLAKIVTKWTAESEPADDIHYLIVAASMTEPRSIEQTTKIAETLLALDKKLAARHVDVEPNWSRRVGELYAALQARDPKLASVIIASPEFGRASHALYVAKATPEWKIFAAATIFAKLEHQDEVRWNADLIGVVRASGSERAPDFLRKLWKDPALREAIFPILLETRRPDDRAKFVECLTSTSPDMVRLSAHSLQAGDANATEAKLSAELTAAVRGLRQMCTIPEARAARSALTTMIGLRAGKLFEIVEPKPAEIAAKAHVLRDAYQPVFLWYSVEHYQAATAERTPGGLDPAAWRKRLFKVVDWDEGDAARGRALFEKKQCNRCHMGGSRLGPDLDGATARFSRSELFATVFEPSRFVPPAYRQTTIELTSGRPHTGILAHDTAGVSLLQTSADTTVRLLGRDIAAKRESPLSIMPPGLLNDLESRDFADLYAYLKSLQARKN